jgi:hypothetical protein
MGVQPPLDPRRLVPALLRCGERGSPPALRQEALRYIDFCIRHLESSDAAVHNLAVSPSTRSHLCTCVSGRAHALLSLYLCICVCIDMCVCVCGGGVVCSMCACLLPCVPVPATCKHSWVDKKDSDILNHYPTPVREKLHCAAHQHVLRYLKVVWLQAASSTKQTQQAGFK